MPLDLYLAFVAATIILVMIPGPNVALIAANSVAHGARFGLYTVAGTTAAMVPQLAVAVLGLATVLAEAATLFEWLRWLGVAYLVFLGVRAWFADPDDLSQARPQPRAARHIVVTGFLVSLTNPKTLLFYGAFMPQFIAPEAGDARQQLMLLAVTFVVLAGSLDCVWALLADRFRGVLMTRGKLRNRLTGGLLIGAGIGMALARKS